MKFYSQEFCDAIREKINSDEATQLKVRRLTAKFQTMLLDCPGGVDKMITVDVDKGKFLAMTLEEKPAPSDWRQEKFDPKQFLFRGSASYDTYCKLNTGELTEMQAMGKDYKVQGDMMKVMSMMPEMTAFNKVVQSIPVEY